MRENLQFKIGNRGLLQEEVGLAHNVTNRLRASAAKHGVSLKRESEVTVKVEKMINGKEVRRVSARGKEPVEVPLVVIYSSNK